MYHDHIVEHKAHFTKCKKMKTISYILFDRVKLEISSKINNRNYTSSRRLSNILWNYE